MPVPAETARARARIRLRDAGERNMGWSSLVGLLGSGDPAIACQELSRSARPVSSHPGWWSTLTWGSTVHTCGATHPRAAGRRRREGLQVLAADQAEAEDPLDQLDPLLVLRQVLQLELLEQQAQLGLHRVDAEEQL